MSVDFQIDLYFPVTHAAPALEALAGILTGIPGHEVPVALPNGPQILIPTVETWASPEKTPEILDQGANLQGFDSVITLVRRQKKRLSRPIFDKWGDPQHFKIVKHPEEHNVAISIERDREYFRITLATIGTDSRLASSRTYLAKLGELYQAGNGAFGVQVCNGEWFALGDGGGPIERPDDPDEDELGIDGVVAYLIQTT